MHEYLLKWVISITEIHVIHRIQKFVSLYSFTDLFYKRLFLAEHSTTCVIPEYVNCEIHDTERLTIWRFTECIVTTGNDTVVMINHCHCQL